MVDIEQRTFGVLSEYSAIVISPKLVCKITPCGLSRLAPVEEAGWD